MRRNSFTLIELLIVMAVIAILTAITLGAAGAIQNKAARARAGAEIQAMSTALESYKLDNGIYPQMLAVNVSSTSPTLYIPAGAVLLTNLNGGVNNYTGAATTKVYMTFKKSQIGYTAPAYYVQDPFGYSYGYSTTTAAGKLMNEGFFDLWSTSGKTSGGANNTNVWMNNWSAN